MSLDTLLVQQHSYVKQLTAEVGQEFFAAFAMALGGRPFPPHALTMVGVTALSGPDALVEISAVAIVPD